MAGGITYDNAASAGGTLFGGLKFWVGMHVPTRKHYLKLIKENGGNVVALESRANILVSDHLMNKRNAPLGSVSYTYVEQSVKKGKVEDVEAHLIRPYLAAERPAGSLIPRKSTRTPFTAEDDMILSQWVSESERLKTEKGEPFGIRGNKIYQELAKKHPHHPWQSWRSRWDHVSARPGVQPLDSDHDDEMAESDEGGKGKGPEHPTATAQDSAAHAPSRVKFTAEDDKILLRYIAERGLPSSGNKVYMEIEAEYPHHTWNSWRARYIKILQKQMQSETGSGQVISQSSASQPSVLQESLVPKASIRSLKLGLSSVQGTSSSSYQTSQRGINPPQPAITSSAEKKIAEVSSAPINRSLMALPSEATNMEYLSKSEKLDVKYSKSNSASTLQRVWRGYRVRSALLAFERGLVSLQAQAKGAVVRMAWRLDDDDNAESRHGTHGGGQVGSPGKVPGSAGPTVAQVPTREKPRKSTTPKEEFYVLLNTYQETSGAQINLWPTIQGRTLELWELWAAVKSLDEGRPASLRSWEDIAENLRFDWVQHPNVTTQLKKCFEDNLGEFERIQAEFEAEDSGSEADSAQAEEEPGPASEALPFRSSPPHIQGRKRAFEADLGSDIGFPGTGSAKRVRYSKDEEIPATPDGKLRVEEIQLEETLVISPHPRKLDNPIDEFLPLSPEQLPPLQFPRPANARLEPETQDFGFDDFQSQPEEGFPAVTPSQQLHRETDAISPIPFSGLQTTRNSRGPRGAMSPSHLVSDSSPHKAVPDSTGVKPTNGVVTSSLAASYEENETTAKARPGPTRAQDTDASPTPPIKRRSLPKSFNRSVSPPKPRSTAPRAAAPRFSSPLAVNGKRKAVSPAAVPSPERHSSRQTSVPPQPGSGTTASSAVSTSTPAPLQPAPRSKMPPKSEVNFEEKLDYYISLGYRRCDIAAAFKATSLRDWPAAHVMESLKKGEGIPDIKGAWTEEDDRDLKFCRDVEVERANYAGKKMPKLLVARLERARAVGKRLVTKHGFDLMQGRLEFLKRY